MTKRQLRIVILLLAAAGMIAALQGSFRPAFADDPIVDNMDQAQITVSDEDRIQVTPPKRRMYSPEIGVGYPKPTPTPVPAAMQHIPGIPNPPDPGCAATCEDPPGPPAFGIAPNGANTGPEGQIANIVAIMILVIVQQMQGQQAYPEGWTYHTDPIAPTSQPPQCDDPGIQPPCSR